PFTPDTSAAPVLTFTLPAGASAGTYSVKYRATVNSDATGSVGNQVVPNIGSCSGCELEHPLVGLTTIKSASPGNGSAVQSGDTITYTLLARVTGGASTQDLVLTDQLGP